MAARTASRLLALLWAPALCLAGPLSVDDTATAAVLPPATSVVAALVGSPGYQAAQGLVEADRFVRRQFIVGPQEWVGTAYAARRQQSAPVSERTLEWDAGLERTVRLPGKALLYEQVGEAKLAQTQTARHRAWREQARLLLERHGAWMREREQARVWEFQLALWQRQLDTVARRQRLGDAARIEQRQAEAAQAQAQVQLLAARRRTAAAREILERQFPQLLSPSEAALPPPVPLPADDTQWLRAQTAANLELDGARQDTRAADAQSLLDAAEQHPDPTVGLRVGQARSSNERLVGVTLSIPFGGEYRAAGAAASAARAVAAALRQAEAERKSDADAVARLRDAQTTHAVWSANNEAARNLQDVADSLRRGYGMGEGSLTDILTAQRLANDQRLATATAAVEAWMARFRLELEAGLLWPEPASMR